MWQESSYSQPSQPQAYYSSQPAAAQGSQLQFYAQDPSSFYPGSRPSLDGAMTSQPIPSGPVNFGGNIHTQGSWWTAFGTGGFEGEQPLLEGENHLFRILPRMHLTIPELGINFSHIRAKSMTVLNPLSQIDERIMDDADVAGPITFIFCFGIFLLLVRTRL